MFTRITLAAAAAISLVAGVSPASAAAPSAGGVSVTVAYDDLDLSTSAGARAMFARITHAAGEICGERPDARLLGSGKAYGDCMTSVTARAIARLGNPKVSSLAGRQPMATMASNAGR